MSAKKRTAKAGRNLTTTVSRRTALSGDPMDLGLLEEMVKLMSQHDLNTVDVRNGDKRVVLKRGAVMAAVPAVAPVAAPAASAPAAAPAAAGAGVAAVSAAPAAESDAGLVAIKSPMVGTFYAAPSPDAKPFVQVGSVVDEDTDVCVIEAMKVFNSIKAECRGTIAKVLVNNASTVEFGQVLFLVKP